MELLQKQKEALEMARWYVRLTFECLQEINGVRASE